MAFANSWHTMAAIMRRIVSTMIANYSGENTDNNNKKTENEHFFLFNETWFSRWNFNGSFKVLLSL